MPFKNKSMQQQESGALGPLNIPLEKLNDDQCKYPTSDGPPILFCGCPTKHGSPYCGHHHSVCYLAKEQWEPDALYKFLQKIYGQNKMPQNYLDELDELYNNIFY